MWSVLCLISIVKFAYIDLKRNCNEQQDLCHIKCLHNSTYKKNITKTKLELTLFNTSYRKELYVYEDYTQKCDTLVVCYFCQSNIKETLNLFPNLYFYSIFGITVFSISTVVSFIWIIYCFPHKRDEYIQIDN